MTINKPFRPRGQQNNDGPRTNGEIRAEKVRVIDQTGEMRGVMTVREAIRLAEEVGLDLIEVSPNADPPVCKILDLGKYKYELQKKAAEARKKQKVIDVKEIKIRPSIGDHDYDVKLRNARRFLEEGDKVKVTMRFRGREMSHQEIGMALLRRFQEELGDLGKVETGPRMEGKQMMMVITPEGAKA